MSLHHRETEPAIALGCRRPAGRPEPWVLQLNDITFGNAAIGPAITGLTPASGATDHVHTFGRYRNLLPEVPAKTPSRDVERVTMKTVALRFGPCVRSAVPASTGSAPLIDGAAALGGPPAVWGRPPARRLGNGGGKPATGAAETLRIPLPGTDGAGCRVCPGAHPAGGRGLPGAGAHHGDGPGKIGHLDEDFVNDAPAIGSGRLQSNVAYRFPLILSLSKDAHTSHKWFDKFTMSGWKKTLQSSWPLGGST